MHESFSENESETQANTDLTKAHISEAVDNAGAEREKPQRLYFMLSDAGKRDEVIKAVNDMRDEEHEFNEDFRYFKGCTTDPQRAEGIEISFTRNVPGAEQTFKTILEKLGANLSGEEYQALGNRKIQETNASPQADLKKHYIIQMPKRQQIPPSEGPAQKAA